MLSRGSARCRPRSGSGPSLVSVGLQCAITPRVGKGQIVLVVGLGRDCRSQTESELGSDLAESWLLDGGVRGKSITAPCRGEQGWLPRGQSDGPWGLAQAHPIVRR